MQLSKGSDRVTITSKAPGKLFIAGEYAVVEPGHGAIVAAVSRYLTVTIDESTSVGTLTSTQNPDVIVEWTREGEHFCAKADHPYGLVEEAILVQMPSTRFRSQVNSMSLSVVLNMDSVPAEPLWSQRFKPFLIFTRLRAHLYSSISCVC